MTEHPRRKSDAARRANQVIRRRTLLVMLLLGAATFTVLFWKLYDLQINRHEELRAEAVSQQTDSSVISASRGTIYDRNGEIMAISYATETVFIDPYRIEEYVESQEKSIEEAAEKAAEKGEAYTPPPVRDQAYIAKGLARILEVDETFVLEELEKTYSQHQDIRKKVDQDVADEVRRFINGEIDEEGNQLTTVNADGKTVLISDPSRGPTRLQGIHLTPDTKRLYPFGSLAGNVLGFVNANEVGAYGLEAAYDDVLQGSTGLTITATDVNGTPLLFGSEQYFDAENGSDLVLTLDTSVQYYLEKGLESMLDKFDAANGGTGIVMNAKTGAILAMASYPNYDPGDFSAIYTETLQAELEAELAAIQQGRGSYETEEDYSKALSDARINAQYKQWRNKCYQDTYEPGSTYKPITLAMALEEGTVNMNSTFNCTGSIVVDGWTMHCSKRAGHGQQILKEAVGNSCNPAFINIGLSLPKDTYYDYIESFGLKETTGIDLPAETTGIFAGRESFKSNDVTLASYAFGQTFTVTPLELIRAQAATINGGYLVTPIWWSRCWTTRATWSASMRRCPCGRSSARRPPPRCGSVWSGWSPTAAAATARWPATASAARPARRIRPGPGTPPGRWWSPSCASPGGRPGDHHAADHGHPQPYHRHRCVRRHHGGPRGQPDHERHPAPAGHRAGLHRFGAGGRRHHRSQRGGGDPRGSGGRTGELGLCLPHRGGRRHRHRPDPCGRRHHTGQRLPHPVSGGGEAGHPLHRAQCGGVQRVGGQQGPHQRRPHHEGHRHHQRQLRQCLRHLPVPGPRGAGRGRHRGHRPVRRQLPAGLSEQILQGIRHDSLYTLQNALFIMRGGIGMPD